MGNNNKIRACVGCFLGAFMVFLMGFGSFFLWGRLEFYRKAFPGKSIGTIRYRSGSEVFRAYRLWAA